MSEAAAKALAQSVDPKTRQYVDAWVDQLRREMQVKAKADDEAQSRRLSRFRRIEAKLRELEALIESHHGEIDDARYKVTRAALVRMVHRLDKGEPIHGQDTTDG